MNWRGRPLVSHEVIVELIAAITTSIGLTVMALDKLCLSHTDQSIGR